MSESSLETNGSLDLSTLFSSLISNPDILSKMSNIISNLNTEQRSNPSPLDNDYQEKNNKREEDNVSNTSESKNDSPTFENTDVKTILSKMPEILSKISSEKSGNSAAEKQQITLLLAIRPYLSERRKELIDTFIKMNKLGTIFKNLT
jgi:hypothetical protein